MDFPHREGGLKIMSLHTFACIFLNFSDNLIIWAHNSGHLWRIIWQKRMGCYDTPDTLIRNRRLSRSWNKVFTSNRRQWSCRYRRRICPNFSYRRWWCSCKQTQPLNLRVNSNHVYVRACKPTSGRAGRYSIKLWVTRWTHHEMRIPERDVTYIVLSVYLVALIGRIH